MGSHDLGRDLGELRGQLDALIPTLERMEERLHQAEVAAAREEARNQGLRKEFDELRAKISKRIADLYEGLDHHTLANHNLKNDISTLKRDIAVAVEEGCGPLEVRLKDVEAVQASAKARNEGWKMKFWKVVEIFLAAGTGALVTWFMK